MYSDLDELRKLRNRIAHHEPIFTRDLKKDFELMVEIVEQRSPLVSSWMVANQDARQLLQQQPVFRGGKLWTPSHNEIAEVAYRIWEEQGKQERTAITDWARAEVTLGLFDDSMDIRA
jgi:hypothetical protein